MYSENNRRSATRRADGEILRRMTGGELSCPHLSSTTPCGEAPNGGRTAPMRDARVRVACDGSKVTRGRADNRCECGTATPTPCTPDSFAPSLAMVYSPHQCWRGVLSPADGLSKGTIFSELVLPFEAGHNHTKEVTIRRPM